MGLVHCTGLQSQDWSLKLNTQGFGSLYWTLELGRTRKLNTQGFGSLYWAQSQDWTFKLNTQGFGSLYWVQSQEEPANLTLKGLVHCTGFIAGRDPQNQHSLGHCTGIIGRRDPQIEQELLKGIYVYSDQPKYIMYCKY